MQFTQPAEQWSFIIDTNSYSGNFERELGAYITGIETIRGEDFVHDIRVHFKFNEEDDYWEDCESNPFPGLFREWPGDHGEELAHIAQTPLSYGKKAVTTNYQSVQIRTTEAPSDEQIKILKEWAYKFALRTQAPKKPQDVEENRDPFHFMSPIKILGFRLQCDRTTSEEIDLGT